MFDIDDTLVDSEERRIVPICNIFKRAKALGFVCALVTARPAVRGNKERTEWMLIENGLDGWESLYLMPRTYSTTADGISTYKRRARDDIRTRHTIVANIGDMWTDHILHPLQKRHAPLRNMKVTDCCVLFPPKSDGEVCIKLVGRTR